jgi:hypothetical protein
MRSNFLKDLSIKGKEEILNILPNFDFHYLREVIRLCWETVPNERNGDPLANFVLTACYENVPTSAKVTLRCGGVRQLKLPEIGPAFFLSEIDVEDLSRDQLEGFDTGSRTMERTNLRSSVQMSNWRLTPHLSDVFKLPARCWRARSH